MVAESKTNGYQDDRRRQIFGPKVTESVDDRDKKVRLFAVKSELGNGREQRAGPIKVEYREYCHQMAISRWRPRLMTMKIQMALFNTNNNCQ